MHHIDEFTNYAWVPHPMTVPNNTINYDKGAGNQPPPLKQLMQDQLHHYQLLSFLHYNNSK